MVIRVNAVTLESSKYLSTIVLMESGHCVMRNHIVLVYQGNVPESICLHIS